MQLAAWQKGGPDDPTVQFDGLRDILTLVKEELSPWAWRAYAAEFRDRQKAEKKLQSLNALPGSGVENKDGVIQGTPLWQERLDKMLLVEHLKKKILIAHGEFVEASELFLKSHAWLVKNAELADLFASCISHVPTTKSERVDLLQAALVQSRKETQDIRDAFEDFRFQLQTNRERWVQKTIDHQKVQIRRKVYDDIVVSWRYQAQRELAQRLGQVRRLLEARVMSLETSYSMRTEELEESQRQWDEEKGALTEDRDKFKKLYNRMLKAHEQAMEDLKQSKGSAEDLAKMVQVLSTEKHMLTQQVQDLEEDKKRMQKQLADLRDEVAKLKKETRRLGGMLREGEAVLIETRGEAERLDGVQQDLEARLDEAATLEATLRDDLAAAGCEVRAAAGRLARSREELEAERRLCRGVARERDGLLQRARRFEACLVHALGDARETVEIVMERARRELEAFKSVELFNIKEDFRKKTEEMMRRNAQLEAEVAIGEAVAPHLAALNPLAVDQSRLCASCSKAIVFEGILPDSGSHGPSAEKCQQ